MHINRLRLLGFKSFVEPTELVIERGLTGVVGPNGCGKSNLLEALRWVMGETSHKSMRASSMDDVIFSGTNNRPARNSAEVTIFIDNSDRKAPAEFNDNDMLEVTRRIEREAGSAYRINGREARAREVRILFEDAATGARSPALVRQGQIAELVNAKPEQRRRILEDAAGIAGLHSRRHEAELRLKAADANLARIHDVLGQLNSQVESLKRQARQARRYKEISADIRKAEAIVFHLSWLEAQAAVDSEEAALAAALEKVAAVTATEAAAVTLEARCAEQIAPWREKEAERAAALHRLSVERDNFEREAKRTADRQAELASRVEQLKSDIAREEASITEAADAIARLAEEQVSIEETTGLAAEFEKKALAAYDEAQTSLGGAEAKLSELTTAVAEDRARRKSLQAQRAERNEQVAKLQRQLIALEAQTREIIGRAPDASKLRETAELADRLVAEIAEIEDLAVKAEQHTETAATAAKATAEAAAAATLAAGQLKTEVETLGKVLLPVSDSDYPPILDQISLPRGFEMALAAALGDDLDAPAVEDAPVHWKRIGGDSGDAELPDGAEALHLHVSGPPELNRRLRQIGLVPREDGARLQILLAPGQRLVSLEGDLWRWDGFVAAAHGTTAAAARLAERNRMGSLEAEETLARTAADTAARAAAEAAARHQAAEADERRLRQLGREAQSRLVSARETLAGMERQARETESRLAAVTDARGRIEETLAEATEKLDELQTALNGMPPPEPQEAELASVQKIVADLRTAVTDARSELLTLEREHRVRTERLTAIVVERERWQSRSAGATRQIETLKVRATEAGSELAELADLPAKIAAQRGKLLTELSTAEAARQEVADQLALAETEHRKAAQDLRLAQNAVANEREARARIETRLEGARVRRSEEARKIREALDCAPDGCLAVAGIAADAKLPPLPEISASLTRMKADRERLGGVNLQADDELVRLSEQFTALDGERADVEEAISKLRSGISQLNREGQTRLQSAFETVNGHFQSLFTTLFAGGEARLEMIEGEDPLEGGLEIIAKPPGKKPATLSLLSGGEQTLTALALIFAVFLTNPSPICVLDEVDAPLDDANVDRFCTLMEKMAADTATRFLVITHHPMTMTRMNRLFGVTMGEKGVSQLVSVDLETAQTFNNNTAAA